MSDHGTSAVAPTSASTKASCELPGGEHGVGDAAGRDGAAKEGGGLVGGRPGQGGGVGVHRDSHAVDGAIQ